MMQTTSNPFSLEAIAQAIEDMETTEAGAHLTELDLWLEHVTSPEYATIIGEAADRLSNANYTAHEAPILEALQSLDGQDNGVTLATIEGILIEAYTTLLAGSGIFIKSDVDWTGTDLLTLSNIAFGLRNIGEFYDPIGGLELINVADKDETAIIGILSLLVETSQEDMFHVISHVSEDLVSDIAELFNGLVSELDGVMGYMDDIIVAQRALVRRRLLKFTEIYTPTYVKRYLAKDCKVGLDVGEQLAETAPFFFKIIESTTVDFAMELAAILCLSSIPSTSMPATLNSIVDELNIELTQVTAAKRWILDNEQFLLSLDEES